MGMVESVEEFEVFTPWPALHINSSHDLPPKYPGIICFSGYPKSMGLSRIVAGITIHCQVVNYCLRVRKPIDEN